MLQKVSLFSIHRFFRLILNAGCEVLRFRNECGLKAMSKGEHRLSVKFSFDPCFCMEKVIFKQSARSQMEYNEDRVKVRCESST